MKNAGLLAPQFQDEDAARKHIEVTRWPDGPRCPHCGVASEATKLEPRAKGKSHVRKGVYQCNACREQFTVTVRTIFEDSHIPLHKWLLAINLMCSSIKGISAHQLMRNLDLGSYRTAWFMAHRIRWALTQEPIKGQLAGVVEIRETYVAGKVRAGSQAVKSGESRTDRLAGTANKNSVVAILQRGGSVHSHHMDHVTANELKPIIKQMVKEGVHIMADSFTALTSAGIGFKHGPVNHSDGEYSRRENGNVI